MFLSEYSLFSGNPNLVVTGNQGRYEIQVRSTDIIIFSLPREPRDPPKGYVVQVGNDNQGFVEPPPRKIDLDDRRGHVARNVNFVLRLGSVVRLRVQDAATGAPIAGATLTVAELPFGRRQSVTGADGVAEMRLPITRFTLYADMPPGAVSSPVFGYNPVGSGTCSKHVKTKPGRTVDWLIKTQFNPNHHSPRPAVIPAQAPSAGR